MKAKIVNYSGRGRWWLAWYAGMRGTVVDVFKGPDSDEYVCDPKAANLYDARPILKKDCVLL